LRLFLQPNSKVDKKRISQTVLNLLACVFNRHAVWYGYNAGQSVDSACIAQVYVNIVIKYFST
jgi:hypothetical protein